MVSPRAVPARSSAVKSRPDKAKEANSTAVSVAYPTMPAPPSRLRSRRARSSGERFSEAPPSRARGSAATRSPPSSVSRTLSEFARSVPELERRNTTREPSGATVNERGAPSVKRWVRACRRGKESGSVVMP
ncbi:hypothetical protein SVIOM74S_09491 [Streptomyces violarus]